MATCRRVIFGTVIEHSPATVWGAGRWHVRRQQLVPQVVAVELASGLHHTCAMDSSGRGECWGWDDFGQATSP